MAKLDGRKNSMSTLGVPLSRLDLPFVDDPNLSPQQRMNLRYKLAGMCRNCGQPICQYSKVYCEACLLYNRKYHREKKNCKEQKCLGVGIDDIRGYQEAKKQREILILRLVQEKVPLAHIAEKTGAAYKIILRIMTKNNIPNFYIKRRPDLPRIPPKEGVSRQRNLQIRYKAAGLCEICGQPAINKRYCFKHLVCHRNEDRKWFGYKAKTLMGVSIDDPKYSDICEQFKQECLNIGTITNGRLKTKKGAIQEIMEKYKVSYSKVYKMVRSR